MQNDAAGKYGDVRNIILTISAQKSLGISAKHNHDAMKHSRLSHRIDFGKEWTDFPYSANYFKEVKAVFDYLKSLRSSGGLFREKKQRRENLQAYS